MSGILFLNTPDLDAVRKFYQAKIGMSLWLDQGDCTILQHGNLMLGFCQGDFISLGGIITFFYESDEEVDEIYQKLVSEAESPPRVNDKFGIYHFYAKDPEGRHLEFQCFQHPLEPFLTGEELLLAKLSVQRFKKQEISKTTLRRLFSHCRYPSSTSASPIYSFSIVQDEKLRDQLIGFIGNETESTRTAPCIAVVSSEMRANNDVLKQVLIGAYHFSMAARLHGLGTDVIEDIDGEGIKQLMNLPKEDHVILAILLGYPEKDAWRLDEEILSNKVRFMD
jgi:catechol 2,3-dioxygenase-like lactoylglutathione lyase family enzyme